MSSLLVLPEHLQAMLNDDQWARESRVRQESGISQAVWHSLFWCVISPCYTLSFLPSTKPKYGFDRALFARDTLLTKYNHPTISNARDVCTHVRQGEYMHRVKVVTRRHCHSETTRVCREASSRNRRAPGKTRVNQHRLEFRATRYDVPHHHFF